MSVPSPVRAGRYVRRRARHARRRRGPAAPGRCHRPRWRSWPPWASARSRPQASGGRDPARPATSSSPRASHFGPGQIHDANGSSLAAAVIEAGGEPLILAARRRRSRGDRASAGRRRCIGRPGRDVAAASASAATTTSERSWSGAGALDFWRIAVQPGKPLAVGDAGRHDGHRPARQSGERARHVRALRATVHPRDARTPRRRAAARPGHSDASGCRRIVAGEPSCGSRTRRDPRRLLSRVRPADSSPRSSGRWPTRMPCHVIPEGVDAAEPGRRLRGDRPRAAGMKPTHLSDDGAPRMVDVGSKPVTARRAVAEATVRMRPEVLGDARRRGRAEGRRVRHRSPGRHRCGEAHGRAHPAVPPDAARPCRRRADPDARRRHGHHPGRGRRDGSHRGRDGGAHRRHRWPRSRSTTWRRRSSATS